MNDSNDSTEATLTAPPTFGEFLDGEPPKIPPPADADDAEVVLGPACAALPERLLLAHARGRVLFLAGAGVSMSGPACLPSFRDLVLEVYRRLHDPLLPVLQKLTGEGPGLPQGPALIAHQKAEARHFEKQQFDVVLGMLERRIDGGRRAESQVRRAATDALRPERSARHAAIHTNLIRLASRGAATAILTTNFDLLLESAAEELGRPLEAHALGAIPRPAERPSFSGVLHLHGALRSEGTVIPDLILTDQDFGEFYLRRRIISDLLYDAARIYHLVLVGYTASDPPVRYLLDAISADDARFSDLKERFVFVSCEGNDADQVTLADWKGRGLTPIPYSSSEGHRELAATLATWADLFEKTQSLEGGGETVTERRVRGLVGRITDTSLIEASDEERGIFDHVIRREGRTRRAQLAKYLGDLKRDYGWLDRILEVTRGRIEDGGRQAIPREQPSGEAERVAAQCVLTFTRTRLEEGATIAWARCLPTTDRPSRRALQHLLFRTATRGEPLAEPWYTAWQLIQESWRASPYLDLDAARTATFEIGRRLERGERSLALAEKIAGLAKPGVVLDDPWESLGVGRTERANPTSWNRLFRVELRTADVGELRNLELGRVEETDFLSHLIRCLEAAVDRGVALGSWIHGKENSHVLGLSGPQFVYFVGDGPGQSMEDVARGIAPSVKLLHAAVERLAEVDPKAASKLVRRWLQMGGLVRQRLWAALARNARLVTPPELKDVLLGSEDREFWLVDTYPELAAVRTLRFQEFDPETQAALLTRLRAGPHSALWPDVDADRMHAWSLRTAVREVQRIREAGGTLSLEVEEWLDSKLAELTGLETDAADHGATGNGEVGLEQAQPDPELYGYGGSALPAELNRRLAAEDPFYQGPASAWLETEAATVLTAMREQADQLPDHPHLWKALGRRHRPPGDDTAEPAMRSATATAAGFLKLVEKLDDATLEAAVEEVVDWWSRWVAFLPADTKAHRPWLRLWPHALALANARSGRMSFESEMVNTPAGDLGRIAWHFARHLGQEQRLSEDPGFRRILSAISKAPGRAKPLGLAHLICRVSWFLHVDQPWAEQHLVPVLKEGSEEATLLWDALCRLGLAWGVPKILAAKAMEIAERTEQPRLSTWSRQQVVSSLVLDALWSFLQHEREPVVETVQLQQFIRRLDGEMRRVCALELWRYLRNRNEESPRPEELFRKGVAPFLAQVWPQERDLVSRGVGHFIARIPAASRGEFVAAVAAVERFLVRGSVTSHIEYGLHGEEDGKPLLETIIDTEEKAAALLRLLHLTVGYGEDAVTPMGLDELMARIRKVAPPLVQRPEFARLMTLVQRSPFE